MDFELIQLLLFGLAMVCNLVAIIFIFSETETKQDKRKKAIIVSVLILVSIIAMSSKMVLWHIEEKQILKAFDEFVQNPPETIKSYCTGRSMHYVQDHNSHMFDGEPYGDYEMQRFYDSCILEQAILEVGLPSDLSIYERGLD